MGLGGLGIPGFRAQGLEESSYEGAWGFDV